MVRWRVVRMRVYERKSSKVSEIMTERLFKSLVLVEQGE